MTTPLVKFLRVSWPLQTLLLDHLDLSTTQTRKGLMPRTARPSLLWCNFREHPFWWVSAQAIQSVKYFDCCHWIVGLGCYYYLLIILWKPFVFSFVLWVLKFHHNMARMRLFPLTGLVLHPGHFPPTPIGPPHTPLHRSGPWPPCASPTSLPPSLLASNPFLPPMTPSLFFFLKFLFKF